MNLKPLNDIELLIAAGLCSDSTHHTEWFYWSWITYAKELKCRHLTWPKARETAKTMKRKTGYPRNGWEKKYVRFYPATPAQPSLGNARGE